MMARTAEHSTGLIVKQVGKTLCGPLEGRLQHWRIGLKRWSCLFFSEFSGKHRFDREFQLLFEMGLELCASAFNHRMLQPPLG